MRKSLFAIGLLAVSYSVQAQNILCHVDTDANMYVSKGALVYSGGGMQMKGTGKVENHGNFMVAGTNSDSFKTIDTSDGDKVEANGGGNFVNVLNEPDNYALANTNSPSAIPNYTYGQLFISGLPQANITGIVDQEVRQIKHGSYQQVGLPFYGKTLSTLSTELGKTFTGVRGSQNEILLYGNANVVSYGLATNLRLGIDVSPAYSYFMLGGQGLDLTTTKTVKGRPYTDQGQTITLNGAGASVNFGAGGANVNQYNEKYNTYVQDRFEISTGGTAWAGDFGKNIYQFSNPFLTNLDLTGLAYNESTISDDINLTKLVGARVDITGVVTNQNGTGTTSYLSSKFLTFAAGKPTGDVDYVMIRPMGTFVLKLDDNTTSDQLNFANLRRFNYYGRDTGTNYSVTASKNTSTGTVKQLGVIGLDIDGNEVGRTYYVVYPNGTTGHSSNAKTQLTAVSSNVIGTFEEALAGGYDPNYTSSYWLYINEANENNFKGKNIKMVNYDLSKIKSYKFEVREDAKLIANGVHQLSTGTGFYYQAQNGTLTEVKQGQTIPVTTSEADLYYGMPAKDVLAANETSVKPSRTMVVYNPSITNYIVRFDPNWKKADIEVYDMSGKLVISKKSVDTSTDFVIELDNSIKNSYVVKIVSDKGETVNTKILK